MTAMAQQTPPIVFQQLLDVRLLEEHFLLIPRELVELKASDSALSACGSLASSRCTASGSVFRFVPLT